MRRILYVFVLTIIAAIAASTIVSATTWQKSETERDTSFIYDGFFVYAEVYGNSTGSYFYAHYDDWDEGVGSYGSPPTFFCTYSHAILHLPSVNPAYIRVHAWGVVTDKFGEEIDDIDADVDISA